MESCLHQTRGASDLGNLAGSDFEAAYSRLFNRGPDLTTEIDTRVREYSAQLELPAEPTLYDTLLLSLRDKDAVFTFNWDPFLFQAHLRLQSAGVPTESLPTIWFLHGNVAVGHCLEHHEVRGVLGGRCRHCGITLISSRLLFPVEHKNYQDDSMIEREWSAAKKYLREAFMFTVFGYSAPPTDIEAQRLLKEAWGDVKNRPMEQVEIINRPGANHGKLRKLWSPFIHTHHYEIHDSFQDSWSANHPRRTLEAHVNQYLDAKFVENNPVPSDFVTIADLVAWFEPLFEAERCYMASLSDDLAGETPPA